MKVTPVPAGYATVTPYLVVPDALALFAFLTNAIGATEVRRTSLPNGSVLNIEMRIGSSMIMLVQGRPEHEVRKTAFYVYVPNVDEAHARGVAAGGVSTMEPADQFYGDRGRGFAILRATIGGWHPVSRTCRQRNLRGASPILISNQPNRP
jgi:PhnB protein